MEVVEILKTRGFNNGKMSQSFFSEIENSSRHYNSIVDNLYNEMLAIEKSYKGI